MEVNKNVYKIYDKYDFYIHFYGYCSFSRL